MKDGTIQRTISEGSASGSTSSKMWRLPSALRKKQSRIVKDDGKGWSHRLETESRETFHPDASSSAIFHDASDASYRQLQNLISKMRSAPSGPKEVDTAFKEYTKIKDQCTSLCTALLQGDPRPSRTLSNADTITTRRDSSFDGPPVGLYDQRSSFSGRSLNEVVTNTGTSGASSRHTHINETYLQAIRDWKTCIEILIETFHVSLVETFKSYEREASPEMIEAFFTSKKYRREAINRMRNASVTRVMSADPQYFPRYEIRFRNYEKTKDDLRQIRELVHAGESGISPSRQIEEINISPRGDTILEFANNAAEASGNEPVLRFRVSSHMLAETSPIFARMFSGHAPSMYLNENEDIAPQLPPSPISYLCKDGTKAKLFRMPQFELNRESAFSILLHAAHMHNETVPREVTFEQFVAIAECALQFKCTSPLELIVEHRWLPQWMHKGADDMPDGLLIISYAFGTRQLFTRMSKSAILNLVDEKELYSKPWPARIRDKIWAVRNAKMAQVHACCTATIREYIRPAPERPADQTAPPPVPPSELNTFFSTPVIQPSDATVLTTAARCPKGSHACDAANLGWMMLMFNELELLPHLMRPAMYAHLPDLPMSSRSLAQVLDALRRIPSPPSPIHRGGVCDPGPAFRSALNDILNSVTGLTLYDISGKSHGWALSKITVNEPQELQMHGLKRMAANADTHSVLNEFPDEVRLQILGELDDIDDLHAAAMLSRAFYNTYKETELQLMRNILRAASVRSGTSRRPFPLSITNAEEKVRKEDVEVLRSPSGEGEDAVTIRSEDGDVSDSEEEEAMSSDDTPAPSIHESRIRRPIFNSTEGRRTAHAQEPDDAPVTPVTPPTPVSTTNRRTRHTPERRRWDSTKPTEEITQSVSEVPLTREEAERILWPDAQQEDDPPAVQLPPSAVEGSREKFLGGDLSFVTGLEDKTLLVSGDKQLSSDLHERVGFDKPDGRPGSSSSDGRAK